MTKNSYSLLAAVVLIAQGPASSADDARTWAFQQNQLKVVVYAIEGQQGGRRSYQILVDDPVRTLARLEVNRDGLLADVWLTDIDSDGAFEVVVATSQLGGSEHGGIDVHEWQVFRFHSTKADKLAPEQRVGYRGHDQFSLDHGRIRRRFPLFSDSGGVDAPTGNMATYEYNFVEDRWFSLD